MRDAKRLCDDVRALAADSTLYRRRATDSLADWGEGMTILQRYSHTPTDIRAHEEGFADDRLSGTTFKSRPRLLLCRGPGHGRSGCSRRPSRHTARAEPNRRRASSMWSMDVSVQAHIPLPVVRSAWPASVRRYSTRGGTTECTVLSTSPSRSRWRSAWDRQHPVTDSSDLRLQLGEPQSAVSQDVDEQQRPFVGHIREDPAGQRVGSGEIRVGWIPGGLLGYREVPLLRKGAFFQFGAHSPTVNPYLPERSGLNGPLEQR